MARDSLKAELRLQMRRHRRNLDRAGAAEAAAAWLPEALLSRFRIVAGYVPMGSEFDPGPVLERFAAAGAIIAFPESSERGAALAFRAVGNDTAMTPDLILAPLLAFDRHGGRLGQGGGSYDRALEALRAAAPVFVIGLAFAGQEVARVPTEPHDQGLDAILTEMSYILPSRG